MSMIYVNVFCHLQNLVLQGSKLFMAFNLATMIISIGILLLTKHLTKKNKQVATYKSMDYPVASVVYATAPIPMAVVAKPNDEPSEYLPSPKNASS